MRLVAFRTGIGVHLIVAPSLDGFMDPVTALPGPVILDVVGQRVFRMASQAEPGELGVILGDPVPGPERSLIDIDVGIDGIARRTFERPEVRARPVLSLLVGIPL
jgi:hypothetical protein